MDLFGYAMGQLAVQSMRLQFDYEAEVSPTRPARTVHAARVGLERLASLAKRPQQMAARFLS